MLLYHIPCSMHVSSCAWGEELTLLAVQLVSGLCLGHFNEWINHWAPEKCLSEVCRRLVEAFKPWDLTLTIVLVYPWECLDQAEDAQPVFREGPDTESPGHMEKNPRVAMLASSHLRAHELPTLDQSDFTLNPDRMRCCQRCPWAPGTRTGQDDLCSQGLQDTLWTSSLELGWMSGGLRNATGFLCLGNSFVHFVMTSLFPFQAIQSIRKVSNLSTTPKP